MMKIQSLAIMVLLFLGLMSPEVQGVEHQDKLTRKKPVLCWYMVCYHTTVENYMEEMALAQGHGIDGFLLDVGQWQQLDKKTGERKPTAYTQAVERMFEAAKRLGTGFGLAMAPEIYIASEGLSDNVKDMLRKYAGHPNYFYYNGRPLFCTYIGRPTSWATPLKELREQDGIDPLWLGNFWNPRYAMQWSLETTRGFLAESDELDGLINFSSSATSSDLISNVNGRRAATMAGKVYAAGVNPTYNSANVLDRRGMDGYGAMWEGAVDDGADMVGIVIWNDYNEDSNLFPGRWPFGSQKQYVSRDESFLDVTAYYSAWFKTRQQPEITQDKFYAVYRTRTQWQDRSWDPETKEWVHVRNKVYPYDQVHDDVNDSLYVSAWLTAPAELTVELGSQSIKKSLPAGIQTVEVPLVPGVPHILLERGGKVLADVVGTKLVIAEETKENSTFGKHLQYRNFTCGTVIGPEKILEAEPGKLFGGATMQTIGEHVGIQTEAKEGSGFEISVRGIKTATYNIRITYNNPAETESRLTLTIDGVRSSGNNPPDKIYQRGIPVSFPPTGKDTCATTSFLWSLFEGTSKLKIDYQLGEMFSKPDPTGDDKGKVFIDRIELVELLPVNKPAQKDFTIPELVSIPGGDFSMGSDHNNPDEAPVRKVTLSPFAIGKYEITNEQYERFDVEHRQFRDSYSWRDRDPVIYVKWLEAAAYCNWLSKAQGLESVYDEKTGAADNTKNGYRLPSEAQWEYVAGGRDENRPYVWGKEEPAVQHCHAARARGEVANRIPRGMPAAGNMPGVVPVGSFALDRTRDGVMDMAGNVSEWCGDWFDRYRPDDLKDPFKANESLTKYRSIRGGSWGYYNYSLRVADREFNTQVYPGYVYIGFRVALPESSWKELQQR
ncbi:MAG: SUMF1/EgtB/PvdO family nonheme iron enzyme [Planctomycetes bacterium]|nr:SUMF1/EgtB/PvdO family nonheme iron enzyme [Planctomycetota bacterium]